MRNTAPVTVGIPTYGRGGRVIDALDRILSCRPAPSEIIVHVDASDGALESRLARDFPRIKCLSTDRRVGPGGGRHRCIKNACQPFFASFDDDSWPIDLDYFARLIDNFERLPEVALIAAVVMAPNQKEEPQTGSCEGVVDYTGCGYALRVDVYETLPGHLDRKVPYGFEERDLSLQLHAAGHALMRCQNMRVFHDSHLSHHIKPEITAGTIENAALIPWLRYPVSLWPRALLQYANVLRFLLTTRRFAGIMTGVLHSPVEVWRHRSQRRPYSAATVREFLRRRKPKQERFIP